MAGVWFETEADALLHQEAMDVVPYGRSASLERLAPRVCGGVADDELLMAMPPRYLPKAIPGLAALAKNGFRYPPPPYGIQADATAGIGGFYAAKGKS